ncbi:DUF4007 family protein [Sphingomonas sp.]|jgi:hypothetical protein|uniref:DUF4007 family protein n=1 Tax=Sphingomonas sp. TaxID=28214 RepID=UPI002DE34565|nr:DUF4007 family protein [Sphingomonas sp.]
MTKLIRFQYGGHATFPVRYGWLPKAIERLVRDSGFVANTDTADELGIGSKMVESLSYWLDVTGLSAPRDTSRTSGGASQLAWTIYRNDPFFEYPGTWWFLHLTMARREGTVWSWFYNDYSDRIFDRLACTDAFLQHTRAHAVRPASPAAAQRDVACLLSAYSARPGVDVVDPDDVGACPLRELGLVVRHDAVSRFERVRNPHAMPLEAFLASASLLAADLGKSSISLREMASARMGPGRILCLGLDAIEELVGRIGRRRWMEGIAVETLAGERHLVLPKRDARAWLEELYGRITKVAA